MERMYGPGILVRTLTTPVPMGKEQALWQYHSRSDRHSKVACWGILFDLLQHTPHLVRQIAENKVSFGINHQMHDFKNNRQKDLDLVLCTPRAGETSTKAASCFRDLVDRYKIQLNDAERGILDRLPDLPATPVGAVHVALEAKACMTAHVKALPRLYDELNSSHLTIHGSSDVAIAVGFVMINAARDFRTSTRGMEGRSHPHRQPDDTIRVIEKVKQLPRRANTQEEGFDALAIVVVNLSNDGSPVTLVESPPAPPVGDIFHYDSMIQRLAHTYESRFPLA
jgi:hypothetical protein